MNPHPKPPRRIPIEPGTRFGRLVVIGEGIHGRTSKSLVRCDCGVERNVVNVDLRRGRSKSCGCLRSELARAYMKLNGALVARPRRGPYAVVARKRNRLAAIRDLAIARRRAA